MSIIWVTHDLDQAARLADHTVVLIDGRVADDATAAA
jgi:ABC-type phosphate transport system ATPase subunit